MSEWSHNSTLHAYPLLLGGGGGGGGGDFVLAVQYGMFRVYAYFCNLVIYRVIINTLLCIPISMTVKI